MAGTTKSLVERFYLNVWNNADEGAAREILAADFVFRASLGSELRGPDGFIVYLRAVHAALGGFTCRIEKLLATNDGAAAKMLFHGKHRGKFFGVEATGRDIVWSGAAFFEVSGGCISELWVLGDVDAVKRQLAPGHVTAKFSVG